MGLKLCFSCIAMPLAAGLYARLLLKWCTTLVLSCRCSWLASVEKKLTFQASFRKRIFRGIFLALVLGFGLSLATTFGCNRIDVNFDNIKVIETMKNGGCSFGLSAAVFYNSIE